MQNLISEGEGKLHLLLLCPQRGENEEGDVTYEYIKRAYGLGEQKAKRQ